MATVQAKVDEFLKSLGKVSMLDVTYATKRLYAAFRATPTMISLRQFFQPADDYSSASIFDGVDRETEITKLGNATMAYVLTMIDDQRGFSRIGKKDEALNVPNDTLNKLITSIFADHINGYLVKDKIPTLAQLRADSSFAPKFKAIITSKFFDPIGGRSNLDYAITLLFAYEYLIHGSDLQDLIDPKKKASIEILQQWQSSFEIPDTADEETAKIQLAKYAVVAGAAFSPLGKASDTIQDVLQSLMTVPALKTTVATSSTLTVLNASSHAINIDAAIRQGSIFDGRVVEAYETQTRRIWRAWVETMNDATTGVWINGLRSAIVHFNEKTWDVTTRTGIPDYPETTNSYRRLTFGPELAEWYGTNVQQPFMNVVALNNIYTSLMTPEPARGSCFVGGTIVRTSAGDKAIENLYENDLVCTRLQPVQWGVRSDEVVRHPSPAVIYAFNDDQPFFTAGHVFHTTTGLRAVQPDIARRENPWIEVGQLAAGHQLLRMTSSDTYEMVKIHKIRPEPSKHQYVYGVHLREGLRSYHANGYLVALNYPEITISMVAKRLMTLSPQTRLQILKSIYEIRPILQQFGAETALDVLALESQSNSLVFGGQVDVDRPFLARDVNMPYMIRYKDTSQYGEQLELRQGLLYIDGVRCPRVAFEGDSMTWSRELPDGEWEHAHCAFAKHGIRASGHITRASEASTEQDIKAKARAFQLIPGTSTTMKHQETKTVDKTSPKKGMGADDHATSDDANEDVVLSQVSVTTQPRPRISSAELRASSTLKPAVFPLVYDPQTYLSREKKPTNATVPCGSISLPPDPDDDDEYSWPLLQIDQYETVRHALNDKIKLDQGVASHVELSSLYTHHVTYDAREVATHEFTLINADCLIVTSDEYKAWESANYGELSNVPPTQNLHYTNLGLPSSFVIPELFQSITIEQGSPDSNNMIILSGVARSYSATSEGHEGPAHWIVGAYKDEGTSDVAGPEDDLQLASDSVETSMTVNVTPHAFVSVLAHVNDDDLNTIVSKLAETMYDQKKINDSSQVTMTNVMQWHMKEDDRKLFFGTASRPSGLPAILTTDLINSPSQFWIRDIYANAYICQVLSNNDANLRDRYKFTEKEKKNIRYFWEGRGKDCLSQSQVYKNLERDIARHQMRVDVEYLGKLYAQNTGQKVSDHIYDYFIRPTMVGKLRDKDAKTGTPLLTRLCAMADALDNGKTVKRKIDIGKKTIDLDETNGNALVLFAISSFKGELWQQKFVGSSHSERQRMLEEEWFTDILRDMVTKILDNDPDVAGNAANQIRKLISDNASQIKDWNDMETKAKVEFILKQLSGYVKAYIAVFDKLVGWVKKGGKWVWEGAKRIWASWTGNAAAVGAAADGVVKKLEPTGFLKGPVLKSLLVLTSLCVIGFTIWSLGKGWENYGVADRGRMIATVFAGVKQLGDFSADAVQAILRFSKKGAYSEAMELAFYARFDYLMSTNMGRNWNSLIEGSNGRYRLAAVQDAPPELVFQRINLDTNSSKYTEKFAEITDDEAINRLGKMSEIGERFNMARKALAFFGYMVSVALAIFMTWQLIKDWPTMDAPTRAFELLQVLLTCIEGLFAAVILGSYVAWGISALISTTAAATIGSAAVAMASIFSAVTVVLAVIAIFVLIAYWIFSITREPPPNAVEQYVVDTGRDVAARHSAPEPPLVVSISPVIYPNDDRLQTVTVSFVNKSSEEQWLFGATLEFGSGANKGLLFRDPTNFEIGNSFKAGNVKFVQTSDKLELEIVNFPHTVLPDAVKTMCRISRSVEPQDSDSAAATAANVVGERTVTSAMSSSNGLRDGSVVTFTAGDADDKAPEKDFDGFKLQPNEQMQIVMYGIVQTSGSPSSVCTSSWNYQTVEDFWSGELTIMRT